MRSLLVQGLQNPNGLGLRTNERKTGANVNSIPRSYRGTRGRGKTDAGRDNFSEATT